MKKSFAENDISEEKIDIKNDKPSSSSSSSSPLSDDDFHSDHSEFGETLNTNKLYEKMPEILENIAKLLKLKV